jgi:dihydroneopterin aldolase
MADILFVNDLRIETILAAPEWERAFKQTVSLDLEFVTKQHNSAQTDQLADTVNYHEVCARLVQFVEGSQFYLVEALAEACANIILQEFDITWVRLRISKFRVIRQSTSAGIIIERGVKPV